MRLPLVLVAAVLLPTVARAAEVPNPPPFLTLDLDRGESRDVSFANGTRATVKVLDVEETRDSLRGAIRLARVRVEIDGAPTVVTSGNYRLPITVGNVQIDCPVTRGYYRNCDPYEDSWGLAKDARLRVWRARSPWIEPGTFVYPARQRWFAGSTQMGNEPATTWSPRARRRRWTARAPGAPAGRSSATGGRSATAPRPKGPRSNGRTTGPGATAKS